MFGMMLREVRFLLFGHFEVGVIVGIDELDWSKILSLCEDLLLLAMYWFAILDFDFVWNSWVVLHESSKLIGLEYVMYQIYGAIYELVALLIGMQVV